MPPPYLLLFAELVILFFISRFVINVIARLLYRITRSHRMTVGLFAFLFLPGTFVHEMAHLLMALVLLVPVGKMVLTPQIDGAQVKLGSVEVGKTDPIRRALIGVAPVIFGIAAIIASAVYIPLLPISFIWHYVVIGYVVFEVGNTMFSSKRDLEGTIELVATIGVIVLLLYITGIRLPFDVVAVLQQGITVTQTIVWYLLWPLGINGVLLLLAKLLRV